MKNLTFIFLGLALFLSLTAKAGVTEADLNRCRTNNDCIIVPYQHCCGSTKKAINKKYLSDYNKNPEWQKFNKPVCANIGMCAPDDQVKKTKCEAGFCHLVR